MALDKLPNVSVSQFPFPPYEEGNLYERRLLQDLPHRVVVRDNVVGKN